MDTQCRLASSIGENGQEIGDFPLRAVGAFQSITPSKVRLMIDAKTPLICRARAGSCDWSLGVVASASTPDKRQEIHRLSHASFNHLPSDSRSKASYHVLAG